MRDQKPPETTTHIAPFPQRLCAKAAVSALIFAREQAAILFHKLQLHRSGRRFFSKMLSRMWTLDSGLDVKVFQTTSFVSSFVCS
jgi:hypothetical protein